MNKLFYGDSFDPWRNLAAEETMFDASPVGMTLYLWQNANTVVIGRNQNAWRECRVELLEQEGGALARRTTGGGAVFHDLGNLNFTFICPGVRYDLKRQTGVILEAVRELGVPAQFTGRNDLVTEGGAKFSGNAFRFSKRAAMQHGTLLIAVEMDKLARYLAPSPEKLRAKGVESVRARVCNLSEFGAHITVDSVRAAVTYAFEKEYGACETQDIGELDQQKIANLSLRNASWEWRLGATPQFDLSLETRFPWGSVELFLDVEDGVVQRSALYSDAMDEAFIARLAPALVGARLSGAALAAKVSGLDEKNMELSADIAAWLGAKSF